MPSLPRVAAVDIGTNTVLLLVAEVVGGELRALADRATVTRIGQGVDASGRLLPEAEARTLACLARYADEARALGAFPVTAAGTSALRDAKGGGDFLDRAAALLGERPRVLSGEDEARATFAGALSGLGLEGEVAVLDVGGGSTEWVVGRHTPEGIKVRSAQSANVGSVRLTERFVHSDPPGRAERQAARAAAREAFASLTTAAPFRGDEALASLTTAAPFQGALVGVAGTVTTFAALHAGQHPYDGARMHGTRLARADIEAALERVAALPLAERSQLPGLDPARADVVVAGGEVLLAALDWCGATSLHVSDRGVRWGLAAERAGLLRLDGRAG